MSPTEEPAESVEVGDSVPGLRPPLQKRSRRTLDRIMRAALELVAEKGVAGASIQEIVDRAGSSVGSFYARFDGKADLLRFLEHRVWGEARERWDAAAAEREWADAPLPDLLEGLVALLLRIERTDAAGRRALAYRGEATLSGGESFRRHITDDVRSLVTARRDEVGHPDPALAVDVLLRTLMGAVRELAPVRGDAVIVAELTRVALAYLDSPRGADDASPDPDGAAMDFFDIWG